MTRENFTSVNVIIDRSGSMEGLTHDTIGGFNTFVSDQKNVPGDVSFTLCLFNTDYNVVHDSVPLASVPNLTAETYRANGYTALYDALGATIHNVGVKLAALPEEERPSKVIFLVITDGEDNRSKEYTLEQVRSMVTHQREKYSWEFVFMGANIDAIKAGTSLGVAAVNSVSYSASSIGTRRLYGAVSQSLGSYRVSSNQQVDFFNQDGADPVDLVNPVDTSTPVDLTTAAGTTSQPDPTITTDTNSQFLKSKRLFKTNPRRH